jgi:DNA-binding NarL/FixJ family response regulator
VHGVKTAILVDPHPLWLDAVDTVMGRVGVSVAGKTTSLRDALALVAQSAPDLVVAEIATGPPDGDGVAWLSEIAQTAPQVKLIVLSHCDEAREIEAAFAAGAVAYVVKTAHPEDLAAAVRQSFSNSIYLPGRSPAERPTGVPSAEPTQTGLLTRRELEILRLVAEGFSNSELARMLWVTEQTVKFHLSNIYRKLDVANRTEASRWAQRNGLLQDTAAHGLVATG